MNEEDYKHLINKKVREESFQEFKIMQAGHEKGNKIYHENLEQPQSYLLTNKLSNRQVSLLFNMRVQCVREIKDNIHKQYNHTLKCNVCKIQTNDQKHILICHVMNKHVNWNNYEVKYEHIFGTLQQK